ncbi:unnamed protein product, partial [marine sediment metagenome]
CEGLARIGWKLEKPRASMSVGDEPITLDADPLNRFGQNLRINMGGYGSTAEASMPPYDWALLSDMTNDGICDISDLVAFTTLWLEAGEELYTDFDRDGEIDFSDFALLANDWLEETIWYQP